MECTVGAVQHDPEFGNVATNLALLEDLICLADKPDLLVLPELAVCGYDFTSVDELASFAERFEDGASRAMLTRLARELSVTLVMGYAERDKDRFYNSCMLVMPDGNAVNYRKAHLFGRETVLFSPGDAIAPVVETPAGRVGLMICFDWFFPEVTRILALRGAQVIAHPSNLVLGYCQRAMYARCVENRVFAITANRIGTESRAGAALTFTGGSQVVDPRGNCLASSPVDKPHVFTVKINVSQADNKKVTEYNDLFACRRPELYGELV